MVGHTDEMIREVDKALAEGGRVAEGDRVIVPALHQASPARPT